MILACIEPGYCGVADSGRAPLLYVLLNELDEGPHRLVMGAKITSPSLL